MVTHLLLVLNTPTFPQRGSADATLTKCSLCSQAPDPPHSTFGLYSPFVKPPSHVASPAREVPAGDGSPVHFSRSASGTALTGLTDGRCSSALAVAAGPRDAGWHHRAWRAAVPQPSVPPVGIAGIV